MRTQRNLWFSVRLEPSRSLSRRGFILVMAFVALINLGTGLFFWSHGAWPILGFCGLDVLALWLALKLSYAKLRVAETVELYDDALEVRRFRRGEQVAAIAFEPYWVRVEMARPVEHDTPLHLASHGRRLPIGAFLTAEERDQLADALRTVLARQRAAALTA